MTQIILRRPLKKSRLIPVLAAFLFIGISWQHLHAQGSEHAFFLRLDSARALLEVSPEEAARAAERAMRETDSDKNILMAEDIHAEALRRAGENAAAISAYERALILSERVQDPQARARLLNGSGKVYRNVGRHDRSLALHLDARALFDSLGNDLGCAQAMHDLAETLLLLGRVPEARQYHERALKLRIDDESREGIAESWNSIGKLHRQLGNGDSALICFKRALAQQKLLGLHSTPVANSLNSIGDVLRERGDVTQALESYHEALDIAGAAGNRNLIAEIQKNLGSCYRLTGDLKQARISLREARLAAERGGLGMVLSAALAESALVEEQAGNTATALSMYRQSVSVRDSMNALLGGKRLADMEQLFERERRDSAFRDIEESRAKEFLIFLFVVALLLLVVAAIALYVLRVKARNNRDLSAKNDEIQEMNLQLQTLNRELAGSEEKYRLLFERLPIGVFLYDNNLQLLQVNDAFVDILGSTREKLEGLMMTNLHDKRIIPALQRAIQGGSGAYEGEYQATTSQTMVNVSIRTAPVMYPNGSGRYGIGFVLDITDWKRIERELIEAKEYAEMADGIKHAFLTSISHEIRTPLNVIMGYFGILQMDLRDRVTADEIEHFAKVDLAVRRLLRSVDQILNLSILESGTYALDMEECPLLDMTMELVEEMRPLAQDKGVNLTLLPSCESVSVLIDRYSVAQALRNILDNAVKFTDHGTIQISLSCKDDTASVSIEDSGIGMSPEYIQQLYESFSQEMGGYTRRYDGLGLGLTLTKRYIDVNNGHITVKSRKGLGTTFTVSLPIAIPVEVVTPAADGPVRSIDQPHVLVVEDDHETQKFLQLILQSGNTLHFADTAAEAWEILHQEKISIILMDISLRGEEDGLQLTRRIREQPGIADVPIIAVTAHAFADDKRRSIEAGCNDYLPKPFRMKQLQELIGRHTS